MIYGLVSLIPRLPCLLWLLLSLFPVSLSVYLYLSLFIYVSLYLSLSLSSSLSFCLCLCLSLDKKCIIEKKPTAHSNYDFFYNRKDGCRSYWAIQ